MTAKRALITGITGQDGQHLSELLIDKGYEVFGLLRGQSNPKRQMIEDAFPGVRILEGDLTDMTSLLSAVERSDPDEVYNLGAISFVKLSFSQPELTGNVTGLGALRLLEAVRILDAGRGKIRFYQASSSEMFGKVREVPQNELTPFHPRSPYGVAKVYAHYMTMNYRESYGLYACSGICFNHEGPHRAVEFVTRKVSTAVARIALGLQDSITMGNLDSERDWGYAGDFVEGMWLMLQQDEPDDYVLATGKTHSIRKLLTLAFREIGIDDWAPYVKGQDERHLRPAEVDQLVGDASKAREELGWEPRVSFEDLVKMMVAADLEAEKLKVRS